MKKIVICAVLFAAMAAYSESGVNAMPRQSIVQTTDSEDGWEYVGKVQLYSENGERFMTTGLYAKVVGKSVFFMVSQGYDILTDRYTDGRRVIKNPRYDPNGIDFVSTCKYKLSFGELYIQDIF